MVVFLALGLALPVAVCGIIFRNEKVVIFATVIMAGVGIASGNPQFIVADLIGVAFGYFIGIQFCRLKSNATIPPQKSYRGHNNHPPTAPNSTLENPNPHFLPEPQSSLKGTERSKKTYHFPEKPKTPRAGEAWFSKEENKLKEAFDNGVPIAQIAKSHGRTTGAIRARLIKLGLLENY